MKRVSCSSFFIAVSFILVTVLLIGCSSSGRYVKPETQVEYEADVDELLGLTEKKPEQEKDDTLAEDDVLKLLGVSEEAPSVVTQREENRVGESEKEIKELGDTGDVPDESRTEEERVRRDDITPVSESRTTTDPVSRERTTGMFRSTSFEDRYQEARKDYLERQYRTAIEKFESILVTNTQHSLSDNCQYWIGESHWGLGNYQAALAAFKKVFSFEKSNKEDAAQLKIGLCYMRLNDKDSAKQELQRLIDSYPSSEYISSARRFLAQLE